MEPAVSNANRNFAAATDYDTVEQRSRRCFNGRNQQRGNFPANSSFTMMNLSPEVAR